MHSPREIFAVISKIYKTHPLLSKKRMKKILHKKRLLLYLAGTIIIWFAFCLPDPLFNDPASTVLTDKNGNLLAARIATDGQWRFPECDTVPDKFEKCLVYFEDQYFRYHPGINPVSIVKSIIENLKAGEIVRGGSTITSQVIRMSRKGKSRTVWEKLIEYILAFRLELSTSKDEVLALYASHAPFGGNVVGLDAAAWRYYGRSSESLSWGEAATLAVLPNAPSLIYPGKNHQTLLKKRNRLLDKLKDKMVIDSTTCELAKFESLPGKPKPLPQLTPHLLSRIMQEGKTGKITQVTIDKVIQEQCNRIVDKYHAVLANNEILNAAAIVLEVKTGNVLAYVGNTNTKLEGAGNYVDIISSRRSSGSTLKPFLYALMLKDGLILPHTLIADVPTHISGFSPKNFNKGYDGAVHASNALARSLNIPAVRMLREYGLDLFLDKLPGLGITTIDKPASYYGLSLILGGAEVSLWELAGAYASMARMLINYTDGDSKYSQSDYHEVNYISKITAERDRLKDGDLIGAGPAWLTFQALTQMNRPLEGGNWKLFSSSKKIAWKTGTSFGHRDALAIGTTPDYVVGVWVGNADGEGRPGLTGASTAAPVMFEIFKNLPSSGWFDPPYDDFEELPTCELSGYKASQNCDKTDTILAPLNGYKTPVCPYHRKIHLSQNEKYQVTSECYSVSKMKTKSWFVLPTVVAWYYKSHNPFYKPLPPFHPDCISESSKSLDLIYPDKSAKVFIPRNFGNIQERVVFEAAHRNQDTKIHWHLDKKYLGSTTVIHQMEVSATEGMHKLTLVSDDGETFTREFEVMAR